MIGAALLAAVCIGAAAALVVRGLSLPRVRAVRQLEQISAYGFSGVGAEELTGPGPGPVDLLGAAIAASLGRARVRGIHKQLMSAGMHTTSTETYLGRYALTSGAIAGVTLLFILISSPPAGWAVFLLAVGGVTAWLLPRASLARRA